MATMPDPNSPSGRDDDSEVEGGNDAFSSAFASFAAGDTPAGGEQAPKGGDDDDDDDAGQGGAERGDQSLPSSDDDDDPQGHARASTAPAGKQAPDPWANASPEIIAERDRLQAELDAAKRSDIASRGRASGLQRQINALQAESANPKPQGGNGKEPSAGAKALDDKIKQIEEDYPEMSGLVDMLKAQRAEIDGLKNAVAPVIEADQQEAVNQQYQIMESRHPDWKHYGNSAMSPEYKAWLDNQPAEVKATNAAYHGWLNEQPASIKALAESWDATEAAVALTLFKTERAEAIRRAGGDPGHHSATTDARRQRQLDGGREVGSRPGSAASGAPDDFDGAFQHFSKKKG